MTRRNEVELLGTIESNVARIEIAGLPIEGRPIRVAQTKCHHVDPRVVAELPAWVQRAVEAAAPANP